MRFDMSEVNRLAADLAAAPAEVAVGSTRAISSTVRGLVRDAQTLAPVLTGELKGSIHGVAHGLSGSVTASAPYAAYVEYGTSDTAPQPFMRPALDRSVGPLADDVLDVAADIL